MGTNFKRSELYKRVWAQPVRTVAAEIGISDVALAKACRKHSIPMPGLGYWQRRQAGHAGKQIPLPSLAEGDDPVISFRPPSRPTQPPAVSAERLFEQRPENRIVVPSEIGKRHRVVRHTLAVLRQQRHGPRPLAESRGHDCFRVRVALASLDRVERILQALVTACESRGHKLVEGELGRSGFSIRVNGESLAFAVGEKTKRMLHQVTAQEKGQGARYSTWASRYDWVPTGVLNIRIVDGPWSGPTFHDRAKAPLEVRLNDVLAAMAETATRIKQRRAAEERREREAAEQARKNEVVRERAELEAARLRRVEELVALWRRQEILRRFLALVKRRMEEVKPEFIPNAQAWVKWAAAYLEEHHPADALFLEPLLDRRSADYWHYAGPRWPGRN